MKLPFGDLMKQAREMQQQLADLHSELADMEVVGESGGGMVKVVMTGRHDVRRIDIDPALAGEPLEMLGDLVAAAVNDAVRRVEHMQREKMGSLAGGLGLAGLDLPR